MEPLCSIIISCYNKQRFIAQAVDSALTQTYRNVEVIAIDDGSRDGSHEVLAKFGQHITCVHKANGGMASSLNVGFALSRGEIIFFLDGDDVLMRETVERVVAAWRPNFSKVHFRLQKITEHGEPIAGAFLPPYRDLPSGNLRGCLDRFGFYPSPPTSGNAFARGFLEQVMPLTEAIFVIATDTPLVGLAPLFGEIGRVDGVGAFWRVSDGNNSSGDLAAIEREIAICDEFIRLASRYAFGKGSTTGFRACWPHYLKRKLILAKFDTTTPVRPRLIPSIAAYLRCVLLWPEYGVVTRLKFSLWGLAVGIIPVEVLRVIPEIGGPGLKVARSVKPS